MAVNISGCSYADGIYRQSTCVKVFGSRLSDDLWAAADVTGVNMAIFDGEPRVEVYDAGYKVFETTEDKDFHEWLHVLNCIKLGRKI